MISLSHLQQKLNLQAKHFAMILTIPDLIAEGLLARGLYNCLNFRSAQQALITEYSDGKVSSLYEHDSFKYLFINEFDDDEIIEDLHQNIEKMAARIERLHIIDVAPIEII